MARQRLDLGLDDRIGDMSDDAIYCRTYGHTNMPRPSGRARRAELRQQGLAESGLVCQVCGRDRTDLIDLSTWEVVSSSTTYPEGYLIKGGQGRLPRAAARKAMFVRRNWV